MLQEMMTKEEGTKLIKLLKWFDATHPGNFNIEKLIQQVAMRLNLNPDEIEP